MLLPLVEHRYVAEILREDTPGIPAPLEIDWIPAVECGRFEQLCRRGMANARRLARPRILPGWDVTAGAPYVAHLEVRFDGLPAVRHTIALAYFSETVRSAVSDLVKAGRISEGDKYHWRICAYRADSEVAGAGARAAFEVEEPAEAAESALPVLSLDTRIARAPFQGPAHASDIPVLIAPQVIREAAELATAAGALECGGILLGRLARDELRGDLFVEITAQIPAREAIAETASLRFTPDTWRAVDAAIRLRRDAETPCGWWHSHPQSVWPCRECPAERRAQCPSNRAFFSTLDVGFHRTAFQRAHNVALLASFLADPAPQFDLFGWRNGLVTERGYYIAGG